MLDMGFEPQIRRVVEREGMPVTGERQTLMFSATFPKEIQKLASEFMARYIFVAVGRVGSTTALITQSVLWAEEQDKRRVLLEQLAGCSGRTIIFVETKRAAEQIEEFLHHSQVPATSIHGDRSQREREQALVAFRRGTPSIIVATDVAARGLDVPECTHVINYELPRDINSYVHRIGRTGRMGRQGRAISFFSHVNKPVARDMVMLLQEANQACPEWLLKIAAEGGASKGYTGRSKFGGRDFRQNAQVRQYRHVNGAAFPGAGGGRGMGMGGGLHGLGGFMPGILPPGHGKGGALYTPVLGDGGYGMYGHVSMDMSLGAMGQQMGGGYQQQQMGGTSGGRGGFQQHTQFYAQYGQAGPGSADAGSGMGSMLPGLVWHQGLSVPTLPPPSPMGDQGQYASPPLAYGNAPLQ